MARGYGVRMNHTLKKLSVAALAIALAGCVRINDADGLATTLQRLLGQPELRGEMGRSAMAVVEAERGAAARTLEIVHRTLAGKTPVTMH